MPPVINFDALKALHDEALRGGNKSGAWFQFSLNMMDAFPILTQQATRIASLEEALRDLVAQIELHTDCMDGRIDRVMLDEQMETAEALVGTWPDFKPDFPTHQEGAAA